METPFGAPSLRTPSPPGPIRMGREPPPPPPAPSVPAPGAQGPGLVSLPWSGFRDLSHHSAESWKELPLAPGEENLCFFSTFSNSSV